MTKNDFREVAIRMGAEVGRLEKAPLANLGMTCCRAAADGWALPEDAEELLTNFLKARHSARTGKLLGQPPTPVQISKLRQFLKLGNKLGHNGLHMLEELTKEDFFDRLECGNYEALLMAARAALKARRRLTDTEMKSLFSEA